MVKIMDDREIETKANADEEQLRKEMGLEERDSSRYLKPVERRWTKDERDTTTVLFGGLTLAHEDLVGEGMRSLGYNIRALPCPDNESLAVGREYGNRGQCNPTCYTVGNLVKYLKQLKDEGQEDIENRYVFVTACACGPCRFGMYEAEYRKALRDSRFGDFRVLLFQQTQGFSQSDGDDALELNTKFALTFLKGIMLGDIVNELGYKIRPYEVTKGANDQIMEDTKVVLGTALREGKSVFVALRKVKKMFSTIKVDYTRIKPKVKITGEFWA